MAKYRDDPDQHYVSPDERRIARSLDAAFAANKFSLHEFFELVSRLGDQGYMLSAAVFARKAQESTVDRAMRSRFFTGMARALYDMNSHLRQGDVRESEVAHFGRFVNVLIADQPKMFVEWSEDMDADDAARYIPVQPTAVIRGVLLSPCLDQRRTTEFWDLSARSERFPRRIFSDPCVPEDGLIFSSYHLRAFGLVFTHATGYAVRRFATHMRENATRRLVRTWDEQERRGRIDSVAARDIDRANAFSAIAASVEHQDNRRLVNEIFGLAA